MSVVTFVLGALIGAFGWFVTKLLFEPAKEILDLRREAQECLIIYGDLSKDASAEERSAAAEAFRRVGAGLVSRDIAAYPWVRWSASRCGADIRSAGAMFLAHAKSTQHDGFSHANLSPTVPLIRGCLRLPSLGTPPLIQAMMQPPSLPSINHLSRADDECASSSY